METAGHSSALNWFIHDSNNAMSLISSLIDNYMNGEKDESKLVKAKMICSEVLHMNALFYSEKGASRSVKENLQLWASHRNYPRITYRINNDFRFVKFGHVRHFISIISELSRNAYKAKATVMDVIVKNENGCREVIVSNDGNWIENPDKIFEDGYSTFGTSGKGMSIINKLCKDMDAEISLTSAKPVVFTIRFNYALD